MSFVLIILAIISLFIGYGMAVSMFYESSSNRNTFKYFISNIFMYVIPIVLILIIAYIRNYKWNLGKFLHY